MRASPPAWPTRLRSTHCFCPRRQAEQPEAEGQVAHFQAKGSGGHREAHQAGAETDQHGGPHHGGYEASPHASSEAPPRTLAETLLCV